MLKTEKDKSICTKFSTPDENGWVHCPECPLMINAYELMCKANTSYNRKTKTWECDDTEPEE